MPATTLVAPSLFVGPQMRPSETSAAPASRAIKGGATPSSGTPNRSSEANPRPVLVAAHLDRDLLAGRRVLDRVRQKVVEDGRDHDAVGPHRRHIDRGSDDDADGLAIGGPLVEARRPLDQRRQIELLVT